MAENDIKVLDVEVAVERSAGAPVWLVVGVAALFSIASSVVTLEISKRQVDKSKSPVVTIDSASIALAKSNELFMARQEGADPRESAKSFVNDLNRAIKAYTDHGIVVINSAAVLNKPAGLDITNAVAKKLGVNMADLDSARANVK